MCESPELYIYSTFQQHICIYLNKGLQSIIESTITNQAQSVTDLLFGNETSSLNLSMKSNANEDMSKKNHIESELDLNDILIGVDRSNPQPNNKSTPNMKKKQSVPTGDESDEELKNLDGFKNPTGPPSDCSFKSRVLYESFRGKNSTIERPKRQRKSILNSTSSGGGMPGAGTGHRTSESTSSYDEAFHKRPLTTTKSLNESNSVDSELLSKAFSLLETANNNRNDGQRRDKEINLKIDNDDVNSNSSVKQLSLKTDSYASNTPVPSPRAKLMLKKQLTINSDNRSLSAVLNENLYKYANQLK